MLNSFTESEPPHFVEVIELRAMLPGESKVTLDCEVRGEPEVAFQWEKV